MTSKHFFLVSLFVLVALAILFVFSKPASASAPPTNCTSMITTKIAHGVNITWTPGNGTINILVRRSGGWPASLSSGEIIYNGTHACFIDSAIGHTNGSVAYYRVWSWSTTTNKKSTGNESKKFIYSNQTVYPNAVTSVEETTATLNGICYSGTAATCGFWIQYTDPVTQLTCVQNVSATGTFTLNQTFSKSITIPSAKYIYVRAWCKNYSTMNHSITHQYFLTKPNAPTNLQVYHLGGMTTYRISWTNASIPATTPINTTIIRWKRGSVPTSITDGDGVNISSNHTSFLPSISGTYYFSAWHYIKDSGSPSFYHYSDNYVWTVAGLTGGMYNFTIRYENTTYKLINLTRYCRTNLGSNHTLIVYYTNRTEYNYFVGRYWRHTETEFLASDPKNGSFTINTTEAPIYFEFRWNETNSTSSPYTMRCNRVLVTTSGNYNYTFYIYTNKEVYGEYAITFNYSLVPYTYRFLDKTGVFVNKPNLDTYVIIYTYDMNGNKMIIHSEFWDTSDQIYPWLPYGKDYFIGIACSSTAINRIGLAPTSTDLYPYIYIDFYNQSSYISPSEAYTINVGWMGASGIFLYYNDSSEYLLTSCFKVYGFGNNTQVYGASNNTLDYYYSHNFTYPGASRAYHYYWHLWLNSSTTGLTIHISGDSYSNASSNMTSFAKLNNTFNTIGGYTPVRSVGDPSQSVSWPMLIIFIIGCFIIFSLSGYFGELTGVAFGGWFAFAGAAVSGLNPGVIVLGCIIIVFSLIYAYNGGKS